MRTISISKQSGLTVIELMVGLLLSLLLVAGVLQVYLGSQTTYRVTEGLSRLQENTRSSAELLAKEIRMAGYIPCSQPQDTEVKTNTSANDWWVEIFNTPIRGFEGDLTTAGFPSDLITADAATSPRVGSDAIIILRAGAKVSAVELYDQANKQFVLQRDVDDDWVEDGSLMIACDPIRALLFQAETVNTNRVNVADADDTLAPGNASEISYVFGTDSQIANYSAVAYFVRQSSSGNGYSLYRRYLNVNADGDNAPLTEELAEGIENMQLLYGLDEDGDGTAEQYIKADNAKLSGVNIDNWRNIASVKIGLLYASEDGLKEGSDLDDADYIVANTTIGISSDVTHEQDRRKRYVSSMTVSLRNL